MTTESLPLHEFGPNSCAPRLLEISLKHNEYDSDAAHALLSAARGSSGESWPERRLALLLLENQLLRLSSADLAEFDPILVSLGLKPDAGFVLQLVHRLRRLNRVHQFIRPESDEAAWNYVLRATRDISKITLARYVFSAQEVADEIVRNLAVSKGGEGSRPEDIQYPPEAPEFETEILKRLCADRNIYWFSEQCSLELNAMVEYPLTSAVVVIKPPGSDLEFEFKRAGTRGARRLNVIGERNGHEAPISHRLFGGSLGWLGLREGAASALFSKIYWLVHGKECPCSRTVMNSSVVTVSTREGELHILDYLTDEQKFGQGFDDMRKAMQGCVDCFPADTGVARAAYQGDAGLTLKFIGQALPQQAIIFDSSSFRLDRIALYLSCDGPEYYFRDGLGRGYSAWEARWLADSVLEEILGEVVPPPEGFVDYEQYVRAVFRVPENRKRADANYTSVMRQIGECWGTLLALHGFSDGESFVQRNVGIKSTWKDGDWQARVIFMDHDDLTMAGSRYRYLWPSRETAGMERDQVHILGGVITGAPFENETIPGDVGALRAIYRMSSHDSDAGVQSLEDALLAAYDKTQSQIAANPELQSLLYPEFIARHSDFDKLVAGFLETDASQVDDWKDEATAYLKSRNYYDELIAEYPPAIANHRSFFERMRFLYSR